MLREALETFGRSGKALEHPWNLEGAWTPPETMKTLANIWTARGALGNFGKTAGRSTTPLEGSGTPLETLVRFCRPVQKLGRSWRPFEGLGSPAEVLGRSWKALEASTPLGTFQPLLESLGKSRKAFGPPLERTWKVLGRYWMALGLPYHILEDVGP